MYEKIPSELKGKAQWANVWNGSKVLIQTGQKKAASFVLLDTWGAFDCAVLNVANGIYDGTGYVFNDDELIGIDIDDGFSEGPLNPLAADIIGHCGSYTEKSRSGRGVHILLEGFLSFKGRNNRAGVEIYRSGRYFIMTGKVIIYSGIIGNQEVIDYIVSRYFPDVPREGAGSSAPQRIYSPIYRKPGPGKIALRPEYPAIATGSWNLGLISLAGQIHNQGYSKAKIYKELLYANTQACKPPLPRSETETIANSVTRYRRQFMKPYQRGDVVTIDVPILASDHVQGGKRPWVIVQSNMGNQFSPTNIVIPLTTKMKRLEMPTHVTFMWENLEQGMVECERVQVIDITEDWKYACTLPPQIMSYIDTALRNTFFYGGGVTDGE